MWAYFEKKTGNVWREWDFAITLHSLSGDNNIAQSLVNNS